MEDVTLEDSRSTYRFLKDNLNPLKLPNKQWKHIADLENDIKWIKVGKDLNAYLAVILDPELNVRVYYQNKLVDWIEWDKPKTEKDMEQVLQIVDDCFASCFMFVPELE